MSFRKKAGFTLVELLVVIAIIALLLAILLPSLQKAKAAAQGVVCQANLRSIGLALQQYAMDNDGYFPVVNQMKDNSGYFTDYWSGWPSALYAYLPPRQPSMYPNFPGRNIASAVFVCPTTPSEWGFPAAKILRAYCVTHAMMYRDREDKLWAGQDVGRSQRMNFISRPSATAQVADGHQIIVGGRAYPYSATIVTAWALPDWPLAAGQWHDWLDLRHSGTLNAVYFDDHVEALKLSQIKIPMWSGDWAWESWK